MIAQMLKKADWERLNNGFPIEKPAIEIINPVLPEIKDQIRFEDININDIAKVIAVQSYKQNDDGVSFTGFDIVIGFKDAVNPLRRSAAGRPAAKKNFGIEEKGQLTGWMAEADYLKLVSATRGKAIFFNAPY